MSGARLAAGLATGASLLLLAVALQRCAPGEELSAIAPMPTAEPAAPRSSSPVGKASSIVRAPAEPPLASVAARAPESAAVLPAVPERFREPPAVYQATVEKLDWYRDAIESAASEAERRLHVWMLSQVAVATVLDARGLYEEPWPGEPHEHRARGTEDYVFTYNRRTYRVEQEDFPELGELAGLDPAAAPAPELVERVLARAAEARAILAAHAGTDR